MSNTTQSLAGTRITSLLDANSFVEIGQSVTARNTDFNMTEKKAPSDGVITGYGVIDGNLVYVYSQDVSVLNGTVGEMHAKKITRLYDMAMKTGAPVIGLIDCAGLRLQEATDALEVSDEIAAALSMGGRLCDSYKRQKRRNGECSLDTDPGFEADVLRQPMTPDEYIEARETTFALYDALAQLPPTQARRVYQHYLLGMSKAEIAAAEGVGRSRICCSIERGLAAMKNILKKSL